jgi:hypothetical protein
VLLADAFAEAEFEFHYPKPTPQSATTTQLFTKLTAKTYFAVLLAAAALTPASAGGGPVKGIGQTE